MRAADRDALDPEVIPAHDPGHVEEGAEEEGRRGDRHDHRDDVQDPQEQDVVPSGEALPHLVGAPEDGIDEIPFSHEVRDAESERYQEEQRPHREPEDGVFHHFSPPAAENGVDRSPMAQSLLSIFLGKRPRRSHPGPGKTI